MQPAYYLLVLALPISVNTQAFGGSPAGGATGGKTSSFPDCAKKCITTPQGNFDNQFQVFCSTLPGQDNCIINACSQTDEELTYQISQKICDYLSITISAPSYSPTAKVAPDVAHSTSTSCTKTSSHTSSSSHPVSTQTHGTTTHKSTSAHSTVRTSTQSSTHSVTHTSSTLSTLRTSTRSSTHSVSPNSSTHASSATTTPSAPKATLSVYNGYVGAYCYTDPSSEAGTSGHTLNGTMISSPSMTIQTCIDYCEKSGWGYAGVENSSNCYCGYGIVNGGSSTSESTCNMGCAGDETQNCGGPKALSVYESG